MHNFKTLKQVSTKVGRILVKEFLYALLQVR